MKPIHRNISSPEMLTCAIFWVRITKQILPILTESTGVRQMAKTVSCRSNLLVLNHGFNCSKSQLILVCLLNRRFLYYYIIGNANMVYHGIIFSVFLNLNWHNVLQILSRTVAFCTIVGLYILFNCKEYTTNANALLKYHSNMWLLK